MNELTPDEHRILVDAIHDSATVIHKGQERIQEILQQPVFERLKDWYDTGPVQKATLEVFVESIIRECVKKGMSIQSQKVSNGSEDYLAGREMGILVCLVEIKRHFGV